MFGKTTARELSYRIRVMQRVIHGTHLSRYRVQSHYHSGPFVFTGQGQNHPNLLYKYGKTLNRKPTMSCLLPYYSPVESERV